MEAWHNRLVILIREGLEVLAMRMQLARYKLAHYDELAEKVTGLRAAINTQQRANDDLRRSLRRQKEQNETLRAEYAALAGQIEDTQFDTAADEQRKLLQLLLPLLTQLPTLRNAVEDGADLSAFDVLNMLLGPLDEVLVELGVETVGDVGTEVNYDPTRHRPVGRGARSLAVGDSVKVRYAGYCTDDEVIAKAEVAALDQPEERGED